MEMQLDSGQEALLACILYAIFYKNGVLGTYDTSFAPGAGLFDTWLGVSSSQAVGVRSL